MYTPSPYFPLFSLSWLLKSWVVANLNACLWFLLDKSQAALAMKCWDWFLQLCTLWVIHYIIDCLLITSIWKWHKCFLLSREERTGRLYCHLIGGGFGDMLEVHVKDDMELELSYPDLKSILLEKEGGVHIIDNAYQHLYKGLDRRKGHW